MTSASTAPCLTSTVLLHSRLKMMPSSLDRSSLQAWCHNNTVLWEGPDVKRPQAALMQPEGAF